MPKFMRGRNTLWVLVSHVLVTLPGVLLAVDLTPGEKKIERRVERLYALDDEHFALELGALLGPPFLAGSRHQVLLNGDQIFPPDSSGWDKGTRAPRPAAHPQPPQPARLGRRGGDQIDRCRAAQSKQPEQGANTQQAIAGHGMLCALALHVLAQRQVCVGDALASRARGLDVEDEVGARVADLVVQRGLKLDADLFRGKCFASLRSIAERQVARTWRRQGPLQGNKRSWTICKTCRFQPIPTRLRSTSMSCTCLMRWWCRQVCQTTTPSERLQIAVVGTGGGVRNCRCSASSRVRTSPLSVRYSQPTLVGS